MKLVVVVAFSLFSNLIFAQEFGCPSQTVKTLAKSEIERLNNLWQPSLQFSNVKLSSVSSNGTEFGVITTVAAMYDTYVDGVKDEKLNSVMTFSYSPDCKKIFGLQNDFQFFL